MRPGRASLLLAAVAGVMAADSVFGGVPARRYRAPDPLPTVGDLDRIEAAARRRAARNAKRAARQRGATVLEWMIVVAIVAVLGSLFFVPAANDRPRDSTDAPQGPRSGVNVRVDALTGCQYVESARGGLSPRLGPDGRPLCGVGVPR